MLRQGRGSRRSSVSGRYHRCWCNPQSLVAYLGQMSIATNFKRSEQNYTELQVVIPELADNFTENSSNPKNLGPKNNSFLSIFPENIESVQGGHPQPWSWMATRRPESRLQRSRWHSRHSSRHVQRQVAAGCWWSLALWNHHGTM